MPTDDYGSDSILLSFVKVKPVAKAEWTCTKLTVKSQSILPPFPLSPQIFPDI